MAAAYGSGFSDFVGGRIVRVELQRALEALGGDSASVSLAGQRGCRGGRRFGKNLRATNRPSLVSSASYNHAATEIFEDPVARNFLSGHGLLWRVFRTLDTASHTPVKRGVKSSRFGRSQRRGSCGGGCPLLICLSAINPRLRLCEKLCVQCAGNLPVWGLEVSALATPGYNVLIKKGFIVCKISMYLASELLISCCLSFSGSAEEEMPWRIFEF
jgi:hypothetical protein